MTSKPSLNRLSELAVSKLWERRSRSINLNYVAWKISLSKPELKKIGCVWSFILLEEFKIYLSWNINLLAYLGSSVKTTTVPPRIAFLLIVWTTQLSIVAWNSLKIVVVSCFLFYMPSQRPSNAHGKRLESQYRVWNLAVLMDNI